MTLKSHTWQQRAILAELEITRALGIETKELNDRVDVMMGLPRWHGMQRNNPLGNGLRILLAEILTRWGDPRFIYDEEVPAQSWFPGIRMPGRSEAPKIAVVAHREQRPRTIIVQMKRAPRSYE